MTNNDKNALAYYELFPTYLNYSVLLKLIVSLLGKKYYIVATINCFISGIIVVKIYELAHMLCKNTFISVSASLLYGLMPSNVMFCLSGAPDYIAELCFVSAIIILVKLIKAFDSISFSRRVADSVATGILLGMGSAYKSFGIIVVMAFGLYMLCLGDNSLSGSPRVRFKSICFSLMIILLLFFSYSLSRETIKMITERVYDVDLDYGTATPHFLLVGLNLDGEGQIHLGNMSRMYYERYLSNGFNKEEAKRYAMTLLMQEYNSKNISSLINHLFQKTIWAWQDDNTPLRYLLDGLLDHKKLKGSHKKVLDIFEKYGVTFNHYYYMAIVFLGMLAVITSLRMVSCDRTIAFLSMVIVGFAVLLLVSEAQSRYKFLIMPFLCVYSGMGIDMVFKIKERAFR